MNTNYCVTWNFYISKEKCVLYYIKFESNIDLFSGFLYLIFFTATIYLNTADTSLDKWNFHL